MHLRFETSVDPPTEKKADPVTASKSMPTEFLMNPNDHLKNKGKYGEKKDPNELGVIGWVATAYYTVCYFFMNHCFIKFPYHTHGYWSLAGSFLLLTGMLAVDFAVSKTPMKNVVRLRANGYNTQVQIASFVWVWVVSHFGSWLFLNMLCTEMLNTHTEGDWYDYLGAEPVVEASWYAIFGPKTLIYLAILFTAADLGFMPVHEYFLHKTAPHIHHMHHVCVSSSLHSSYVFHALDIVCEFGTPVATATLTHLFILKDPVSYYMWVAASVWWYFMGHDETLKMAHWRHHKYRVQDYSAYWFALFSNN